MSRAIIRADASASIGAGHVVRCLALMQELSSAGWSCALAGQAGTADYAASLGQGPIEFLALAPRQPEAEALKARWAGGADLLVVDNYSLDAGFETECRGWAGKILVIDELADRKHDADFLLDPTYGREPKDYAGLVPIDCQLLLGADYALLRPEFADARPAALARRVASSGIKRILVAVGATDPLDYTTVALGAIAKSGFDVHVDVILSSNAPKIAAVRDAFATATFSGRLVTDASAADVAALMASADIAIGSGGASAWERCCLGLPTLAVVLADNQKAIVQHLSDAGAVRMLDVAAGADGLAAALLDLAQDPASLRRMSERAAMVCDGAGLRRVVSALLQ